jgi:hypothetical protein
MLFVVVLSLALGPRYQSEDFHIESIFPLESFSSGLQSKYMYNIDDCQQYSSISSKLSASMIDRQISTE